MSAPAIDAVTAGAGQAAGQSPRATEPPIARRRGKNLRRRVKKALRRLLAPQSWYLLARKTRPISAVVGSDRGRPVDRFFIERFLEQNADRIRGAVLEVKDRFYTTHMGGNRVTRSDVVDANAANPDATIHSDIRNFKEIPDESYDCFILTQVLQYIDDLDAAVRSSHRILKPGGCLLVTVPTLGKLDGFEDNVAGNYWRFTADSARYLFGKTFDPANLTIEGWGNLLVATSFLQGMAVEDLPRHKLLMADPRFTCGVTIRAVK